MQNTKNGYCCDWCTMSYPLGGWDYYQVRVFAKTYTICSDCYKHLHHVTLKEQYKEREENEKLIYTHKVQEERLKCQT